MRKHEAKGVPGPDWMTPDQVADEFGLSRWSVYELFGQWDRGEKGGLRYHRVGSRPKFVHRCWYAAWIAGQPQTDPAPIPIPSE